MAHRLGRLPGRVLDGVARRGSSEAALRPDRMRRGDLPAECVAGDRAAWRRRRGTLRLHHAGPGPRLGADARRPVLCADADGPAPFAVPTTEGRPAIEPIAAVPERPFLMGTMMGGPGGLLAMASMAMPLGLALLLHVLAPRGSRESLTDRLAASGHGSLAMLLVILLTAGAFLVGMMSGPRFCWPFAAAPADRRNAGDRDTRRRRASAVLCGILLASLGLAAWCVRRLADVPRQPAAGHTDLLGVDPTALDRMPANPRGLRPRRHGLWDVPDVARLLQDAGRPLRAGDEHGPALCRRGRLGGAGPAGCGRALVDLPASDGPATGRLGRSCTGAWLDLRSGRA